MTQKSGSDLVAEAKARIQEVTPADALAEGEKGGVVFLDVREPNEWNLGHVPGAIHVPRGQLENKIEQLVDRDARVIVYCAGGGRAARAAGTHGARGYTRAGAEGGGVGGWVEAGGEIED